MGRTLLLAPVFGATCLIATAAHAEGPGIYSHTFDRTHTARECLQRAGAVADAKRMRVEGSSSGLWMGNASSYSHAVRCDIPGKTLIITAGPAIGIRSQNEDIRFMYATARLGD